MKKKINQTGQALVLLLIYVVIAITITTAAIAVSISSSQSTDKVYQGATAFDIAESGAETAILKLLRDPNYTGETLTVSGGTATITITGSTIKTVTSRGTIGNFTRTILATVDTSNNVLVVTSWKEQ